MKKIDIESTNSRYNARLEKHGYGPEALGWGGGLERQNLRFRTLLEIRRFKNAGVRAVLDIGCGFADLYGYIRQHQLDLTYKGIDINPNFLLVAKEIFGDGLNVDCVNILDEKVTGYPISNYDLVVASGIFNYELNATPQEIYITNMLKKMFQLSNLGVAVDFMTSDVDWRAPGAFHVDPRVVYKIARAITPKVVVRQDYLDYEFCVYLIK